MSDERLYVEMDCVPVALYSVVAGLVEHLHKTGLEQAAATHSRFLDEQVIVERTDSHAYVAYMDGTE